MYPIIKSHDLPPYLPSQVHAAAFGGDAAEIGGCQRGGRGGCEDAKGGQSPEKRMGKWAWNLVGTKLELFEDMSFDQVMTNIPFTFVIFSIKPTVNQVILWMDTIL
jgi:hypothetical protein